MDDARERILAAAAAVFAQKGFADASMNDILRAAGVSKGGIYWHFSSKNEIVAAIFDHYFDAQLDALNQMLNREGSVTSRLQTYIGLAGAELALMAAQFPSSLEFYALAARDTFLRERLSYYFAAYRERIQQLIQQAVETGEWETDAVDSAADAVIALFEGTLLIWSVLPQSMDLGERLSAALEVLLRGLRPPDTTKAAEEKE